MSASSSSSSFAYLACNGVDAARALEAQLPAADLSARDLVTLTVGGDEPTSSSGASAGGSLFRDLVVACVYAYDEAGCDARVAAAEALVAARGKGSLRTKLVELVAAVAAQVRPGAAVVVTGYARFFGGGGGESECPLPFPPARQRRRLDGLSLAVNGVIEEAAMAAAAAAPAAGGTGVSVVFADVDALFEGHRFCDATQTGDGVWDWWFNYKVRETRTDERGKRYEEVAPFHPTWEGQGAYLEAVQRAIGCVE